jgi:hypothetical protein
MVFSLDSLHSANSQFTYRLIPAEELSEGIQELDLGPEQRKEIFEVKVNVLERIIGKSGGDSEKLLRPQRPYTRDHSVGLNGFSSTERGILAGITSMADAPGFFAAGRYGFLHGVRYLPDLIFQIEGILTTRKKGYLNPQFLLSYPISVSTKLMGGTALITDTIDFSNRQWDLVAGLEIRLGHIQIYGGYRSGGGVNDEVVDVRLAYFF